MHATKYVCKFLIIESTSCEQHFGQDASLAYVTVIH